MSKSARLPPAGTSLLVAAIMLVATACASAVPGSPAGGNTPDGATPGSGATGGATGDSAELEQAARDSFNAFLDGDDQAYFDALSAECRERLGYSAVQNYLSGRRFNAANLGEIDLSQVSVGSVEITSFSGSNADVALVLAGTTEPFQESRPHRWTFEEGSWRLADCSAIRESPNSLEGQGTDRSAPLQLGEVTDIGGWLVALTHVDQDLEAVLGADEVEPAAAGNNLTSAQLLVTYNGAEPSVVIGEHLAFDLVAGADVYGEDVACRSDLDGLFYDPTVVATPGEDLPRPMVCREVPESAVSELLLRTTHLSTGTEFWFDLSQT